MHNHSLRSIVRPIVVPGLLALSVAASAADIENITVTASRTPTRLDNTGSAVTILTSDEIARRAALSVADLLRDVPGVAVGQQGGVGTLAQVRMRGAEANQVLVLIDGIEANDVAQGSEFNFAHIMTDDIKRIEVVRGPQSAIWGSDALAGVINIITRTPDSGEKTEMSLASGNRNAFQGNLDYQRRFEGASFGVGASHYETAGSNISRRGDERDGYNNSSINLMTRVDLGKRSRLSASWRGINSRTDFDGTDFANTGLPVDAPWTTDAQQRYARIALDTSLTDRVSQNISLTRTLTRNVNHTDASVNDVTRGRRDKLHLQTNAAFGNNMLSLVAEHENEHDSQRGTVSWFGDPNRDLSTHTNSLAAEVRHDGELFALSASARRDINAEYKNANTWRLTGLWHVTDSVGAFASWGRASKNPTFTERFGYYTTFIGNPSLRPEQSVGWELGLRGDFSETGIGASASYFRSRLQDEINSFVYEPALGAYTAKNLDSDSHRRGVELEAHWAVTPSISLHGSYTWLDATAPGADGKPMTEVRRPRNMASARINYAWDTANVNVGVDYNGAQWDDFFPPYPPYQTRVELPGYTTISLSGEYKLTQQVRLTASVQNLLNTQYENVYGFRGTGIAARAGIRMSL